VLGLPASEVRDSSVAAPLVLGPHGADLEERLAEAEPNRRLALFVAAVANLRAEPDPLVEAAARQLSRREARVGGVAYELGLSERQLHRRTLEAVGYGPKMLGRVARLRRLIGLGAEDSLASRAFDAGYSSQSHMTDEVRRLTGTTPVRFLEDAVLTAA
jgi:methylphosphotriester-DNA--protein-cysteine methyltransferase